MIPDNMNGEGLDDDDEITITVDQFQKLIEEGVTSATAHVAEIVARAEMVANASESNLPYAVEALKEAFGNMGREDLEQTKIHTVPGRWN